MDENAKKAEIVMVGHAHIDPVWLWPWEEGFAEIKATFRSALDRMKEFPDFIFTASSAAYYEWIEQNDPEMFREIQVRVKEGRWVVAGGWWVEPDCNIPSGESFARQALYAQRYFRQKFGVTAKFGFCPDSFGHNGMLPQLLRKGGMGAYVFMRPEPREKELPARTFLWESHDGSRVAAFRIAYSYGSWGAGLENDIRRCAEELSSAQKRMMCFYGVGNHGGGPTVENIRDILRLQGRPDLPKLTFGSPGSYFKAERSETLPVVHGELLHHASGCYSAHSGVKKWNRRAENRLLRAEKLSVLARAVSGLPYPKEDFTRAWKDVLFNQFHDALAGTCIQEAYRDVRNAYGEAMIIAARRQNAAAQSVSWKINIPPEEGAKPIVVFHPHGFGSRTPVELESFVLPEETALVDESGREIPYQIVRSASATTFRSRICFLAELPPLGYRVYRLVRGGRRMRPQPVSGSDTVLENRFLRVEFDPASGCIRSLLRKKENLKFFSGPAARLCVLEDRSDTWSHDVFEFQRETGCFTAESVRMAESGPVRSTVRVVSRYGKSSVVQDFSLYGDLDRLDVKVTVDWRESFSMLKIKFPLNFAFQTGRAEIPYGFAEREADGKEYPMQSWLDVSGRLPGSGAAAGLSILNDGKYSYSLSGGEIGLTALRSPIYAHHNPYVPDPEQSYEHMDQGKQTFRYVLCAHAGPQDAAQATRAAMELNQRPFALYETFHAGPLPQNYSFLRIEPGNILLGAMKESEDGDGVVLRLFESRGRRTDAELSLPALNRTVKAVFKPHEIKTLLLPNEGTEPVRETDFMEWTPGEREETGLDV